MAQLPENELEGARWRTFFQKMLKCRLGCVSDPQGYPSHMYIRHVIPCLLSSVIPDLILVFT